MDEYDTSQINAGLLVEAGDGGGGAPVPGGCSRTSLVLFLLPGKRGPYLYSKERPYKHRGGDAKTWPAHIHSQTQAHNTHNAHPHRHDAGVAPARRTRSRRHAAASQSFTIAHCQHTSLPFHHTSTITTSSAPHHHHCCPTIPSSCTTQHALPAPQASIPSPLRHTACQARLVR